MRSVEAEARWETAAGAAATRGTRGRWGGLGPCGGGREGYGWEDGKVRSAVGRRGGGAAGGGAAAIGAGRRGKCSGNDKVEK
jgi:hypothetical protein